MKKIEEKKIEAKTVLMLKTAVKLKAVVSRSKALV